MEFTDPAVAKERFKTERNGRTDRAILDELRALDGLPDEQDPSWDHDTTWLRAHLLTALAEQVASRRLEEGVGLVLDKMCFGDPGEVMRGMRHHLEAAISPDWSRLTSICVSRCSSERAGTRYWAVDELGVLRDATAMPTVLQLFDDGEPKVASTAFRAAAVTLQHHPDLRSSVIKALRRHGQRRTVLRDEALSCIREIQCAAPAIGEINHAELEASLARAIRAYRDGQGREGELSSALEWLLVHCLGECDEWDGSGVPDGLSAFTAALTSTNTFEVRGGMTSFKDRGHCVEPFEASVSIAEDHDSIDGATIRYGDALTGLGAVRYGERHVGPETVTDWLFVFRK